MDHNFEDRGAEFSLFPGVDLRLWVIVIAAVVGAAAVIAGVALTVG